MVITGQTYQQEGNIMVQDNATLTIRNVEFDLNQFSHSYSIEIRGNGHLVVEEALMSVHADVTLYGESVINVWDHALVEFKHSHVIPFDVKAYSSSTIIIVDSDFTYGQVWVYDQANVSVHNSTVQVNR
jgi:hypothetical protein